MGDVELRVDEENSAETWWSAARNAIASCPVAAREFVGNCSASSVTLSAADAQAFMTWAASLPGWADGPAHAPLPVVAHHLVTDDDIAQLETAAGESGDLDQVAICRRALRGDETARAECARVLAEAEAAAVEACRES